MLTDWRFIKSSRNAHIAYAIMHPRPLDDGIMRFTFADAMFANRVFKANLNEDGTRCSPPNPCQVCRPGFWKEIV